MSARKYDGKKYWYSDLAYFSFVVILCIKLNFVFHSEHNTLNDLQFQIINWAAYHCVMPLARSSSEKLIITCGQEQNLKTLNHNEPNLQM